MASSVCTEVISSMVVSTSTDAVIWSTLWTSLDNHSGLSRVAPNCESPPSDRPGSPLPSWKTQHIKTLHHYMSCRQFHLSNNVWSFALFAPNKTLPLTNSAKLLYSNCVYMSPHVTTCHHQSQGVSANMPRWGFSLPTTRSSGTMKRWRLKSRSPKEVSHHIVHHCNTIYKYTYHISYIHINIYICI